MSFIHDALKKAQQRKNGSYSNYEKLITDPRQPVREKNRRRAKWLIIPVVVLILASAAIIIYQESSGINFSARKSSVKAKAADPAQAPAVQPQAPPVDTAALYQEALKNQLANDNAKAEAIYRQIIASNPGQVDALNNLGVILMSAGKAEGAAREAIDLFNKAISLKPDFADAYYNLACSYAKLNQLENGLQFLEHAILIKPELAAFAGRDGDLQNLRSSPKFKQVINKKEQG
jgi:tetratricopeptide (TPR) repeat protein